MLELEKEVDLDIYPPACLANKEDKTAFDNQGLCRLGLEFFSNGPENIYPHQTK